MSHIRLTDMSVEIPLRGLRRRPGVDPRIRQIPGGGLVVTALRNITFEAEPGDRIGIIGGNGAGKTTLLRVIAGIIPPVSGTVEVSGQVHGIFNISDGMRTALSGRENARLRYYLLDEPGGSLDNFIANVQGFADLGEFFDLPMSTYSPGMTSRLLFAMSTVKHANILLLDEWIGVADRAFQDKAASRLRELVAGNEIFFIASHDRTILRQMTDRVIVLRQGLLEKVIDTYELD